VASNPIATERVTLNLFSATAALDSNNADLGQL
jgi:hypothetical protein